MRQLDKKVKFLVQFFPVESVVEISYVISKNSIVIQKAQTVEKRDLD